MHDCVLRPHARQTGAGGRRAVVLQAPDKAVLSFSGPLNLARAEFTKLKGARLEGEVKIWSREAEPGADDALSIVTRNVQILPQQIWTAHEVTFAYGASHGTGRDLSITVSQAGQYGAANAKDALVKNLESLELAHLDQLVVHVPANGLLGDCSQPRHLPDPPRTQLHPRPAGPRRSPRHVPGTVPLRLPAIRGFARRSCGDHAR